MVLLTALLCAGVLGLAAAVTAILFLVSRWSVAHLSRRRGGATVLCVTAHPDDESMFFVPVLRCAAAAGMRVHLLCLSTGNAEGLGDRRRGELRAAWRALALPDGTVDVVDDPRLQDGMRTVWDVDSAAAIVQDCLRRMPGPCTVRRVCCAPCCRALLTEKQNLLTSTYRLSRLTHVACLGTQTTCRLTPLCAKQWQAGQMSWRGPWKPPVWCASTAAPWTPWRL